MLQVGGSAGSTLGLADIDIFSVVALSGAVAECQAFGSARGVQTDLATLNFLMAKCQPRLGSDRQQSQTRWAALASMKLLARHEGQLQALIGAFKDKRSVSECIAAVEAA